MTGNPRSDALLLSELDITRGLSRSRRNRQSVRHIMHATSTAWLRDCSLAMEFCEEALEDRHEIERGRDTQMYVAFDWPHAMKIGVAVNPGARFSNIQSGTWRPLTLYCAFPATVELEACAHRVLSPYLIRGEWFRCTIETLAVAELFRAFAEMCDPIEDACIHETLVMIEDTLTMRMAA